MATTSSRIVCLLDCDNTLLDNDGLKADLDVRLQPLLTDSQRSRFWEIYEQARSAEGTVDYPATFARMRPELDAALAARVWSTIWDYPFADRLYPSSLAAIAHLQSIGCVPAIVSDGDPVYQPHKIEQSGLNAAVDGRVLIYIHKQQHLDEILAAFPADHYVMIEDKGTILVEFKRLRPALFTTVHIRQGHYGMVTTIPQGDFELDHIGDVVRLSRDDLLI